MYSLDGKASRQPEIIDWNLNYSYINRSFIPPELPLKMSSECTKVNGIVSDVMQNVHINHIGNNSIH